MTDSPAYPLVLQQLAQWKAETIDQTVERIRLALAAGHPDRAYRVLGEYERTIEESPPCESVLSDRCCSLLRRRGVYTVADLRAAAGEIDSWQEIGPELRRRIIRAAERLGSN